MSLLKLRYGFLLFLGSSMLVLGQDSISFPSIEVSRRIYDYVLAVFGIAKVYEFVDGIGFGVR
jgi:hypothetical protein